MRDRRGSCFCCPLFLVSGESTAPSTPERSAGAFSGPFVDEHGRNSSDRTDGRRQGHPLRNFGRGHGRLWCGRVFLYPARLTIHVNVVFGFVVGVVMLVFMFRVFSRFYMLPWVAYKRLVRTNKVAYVTLSDFHTRMCWTFAFGTLCAYNVLLLLLLLLVGPGAIGMRFFTDAPTTRKSGGGKSSPEDARAGHHTELHRELRHHLDFRQDTVSQIGWFSGCRRLL